VDEADLLPISALQHLLFCERQAALIHVEQLWAENRLTVEGRQLHTKAHDPRARGSQRQHAAATSPAVRVQRSMHLVCHRLGLFGVSDTVEFPHDGVPRPVEYKRGRPKKHDADKVQVCAQAMCLEEMLGLAAGVIAVGTLFYGQTRRRLDVSLDVSLRAKTEAAAARMHEIIRAGITPPAFRERKCDHCSLLDLCLPHAMRPRRTAHAYLQRAAGEALAIDHTLQTTGEPSA
jgi:CRISPR-associated exonuclease Cas4